MIYDKIPIILLSKIASLPDDTTNCRIATYLLNNLGRSSDVAIQELASACQVANSSISRFCREVGFSDYSELKEYLGDTVLRFERASGLSSSQQRAKEHAMRISASLEAVTESLDFNAVHELVADISRYERVTAFGLLKAETAALNLQTDLLMLGKVVRTKVAYDEQQRCLQEADEGDLIVIFSYTGGYFGEGLWDLEVKPRRPRIYLVTGGPSRGSNPWIHRRIAFTSKQDQISHPYQLLFVSSLISQEYSNRSGSTGHSLA